MTGFQGMRPNIRLYCIDQEWDIQVIKEYFIYYGPAHTDQKTMTKRGNRKKLIDVVETGNTDQCERTGRGEDKSVDNRTKDEIGK